MAQAGEFESGQRQSGCIDPMVGAILSGWRYDVSGLSPVVRGEYQSHMDTCRYCQRKQRVHRTVDFLLLGATTLSFAAFLLAAVVMHRLEALTHIGTLRLHVHPLLLASHVPSVITISLEAVAVVGVLLSMLLWVLVAISTPIPTLVTGYLRSRQVLPGPKQAA